MLGAVQVLKVGAMFQSAQVTVVAWVHLLLLDLYQARQGKTFTFASIPRSTSLSRIFQHATNAAIFIGYLTHSCS